MRYVAFAVNQKTTNVTILGIYSKFSDGTDMIRNVVFERFSSPEYTIKLESQEEISVISITSGYFKTYAALEYTYKVQPVADELEIYGKKESQEVELKQIPKKVADSKPTEDSSDINNYMNELKTVLSKRKSKYDLLEFSNEANKLNLDAITVSKPTEVGSQKEVVPHTNGTTEEVFTKEELAGMTEVLIDV